MAGPLEGLAPWPRVDHAAFGAVEERKLSKIQKLVGSFLRRNWVMIPHVTHHDDADVTELERWRAERNTSTGVKITPVPVLAKALSVALRDMPQFNVSVDPEAGSLVAKHYVNVGVAVDTPGGLLVPVIRDADTKSLDQVAEEIAALSAQARSKGLTMEQMSGGCITLTSLGHIGGTGFTPIVNAPEVAILGVARARPVPVPVPSGELAWRQMLPLSLSYDHRVINGADAARFCRRIADLLANPAQLV